MAKNILENNPNDIVSELKTLLVLEKHGEKSEKTPQFWRENSRIDQRSAWIRVHSVRTSSLHSVQHCPRESGGQGQPEVRRFRDRRERQERGQELAR